MPPITLSKGNSETASYLERQTNQIQRQHFDDSAALGRLQAYSDLFAKYQECQNPNWDGDGAFPVESTAFWNTYQLIESLPLGCPPPAIGVEPDGHLTLEWYRHPRWILSVSVSPERILYYASLFGSSEIKGAEKFFDQVPPTILDLIQRVQLA